MNTPMRNIADTYRFDVDDLRKFARQHPEWAWEEGDEMFTNTWWANDLINAYKKELETRNEPGWDDDMPKPENDVIDPDDTFNLYTDNDVD